jgi:indole-3-glycerol phosphate synthase
MTITLQQLVQTARETAARQRERLPTAMLDRLLEERELTGRTPGRFRDALRQEHLAVIAEVKGASPVDGELRADLDPPRLAASYERAGAAAISVLTEERYFAGSLEHLAAVAKVATVPLLRKDFIVEEYQIGRAALAGASAVLLIADALAPDRLRELVAYADGYGLDALIEVHDPETLPAAVAAGSGLIGVNNRDLRTMVVDWEHSLRMAESLPSNVVRVAESGIATVAQATSLRSAGYDAILVGSALVRTADPESTLRGLCGVRGGRS